MSKFEKKRGKSSPAISTASLPDIIFMLLFFFMMVTVMRDSSLKVAVVTPSATELTKLEKKSLVNFLYIGKPTEEYRIEAGSQSRLQLGDKFATEDDIPLFLENHRQKIDERQRGLITSSLKVDQKTTMGIVGDIKTALRKAGQYKVNYSAKKKAE
jgi:biopolymer transport protein ExbD